MFTAACKAKKKKGLILTVLNGIDKQFIGKYKSCTDENEEEQITIKSKDEKKRKRFSIFKLILIKI